MMGIAEPAQVLSPEKRTNGVHLQYLGFSHAGNVRMYRFRRIVRGEEAREYVIDVDLALFVKHHVALQEGPGLSMLRLLSGEAGASAAPASQSLTDLDMLAHLASRPDRSAAKFPRSKRRETQSPENGDRTVLD